MFIALSTALSCLSKTYKLGFLTRIEILAFLLVLAACSSDNLPDVNQDTIYLFEDGFEVSSGDLMDLFPSDGSRWSNLQQVDPAGGMNEISLENTIVSEGNNSLKIYAHVSDSILSKADIEKGGFNAPERSTVKIAADFFIATTDSIENLLLIDLECCSCWDPSVADNQCPGVSLMMKENDHLSIERGKILGSSIVQTDYAFPRNQWVRVEWESRLSQNDDGFNKLTIDGVEVISENGMNMPNAEQFEAEFAESGIDFELQEPLFYERFQIGATANASPSSVELYVYDVRLEILE